MAAKEYTHTALSCFVSAASSIPSIMALTDDLLFLLRRDDALSSDFQPRLTSSVSSVSTLVVALGWFEDRR